MNELPIATIERIIRMSGAERVSKTAAEELADVLEEEAMEIAKEAIEMSAHAGRVTVTEEDIRLAEK